MEDAERLARRVIALAWMDAFGLADIDRLNRTLMQEAMWFLVAPAGEWAEARVSWCAVAGICPDDLRRQAIENAPAYRAGMMAIKDDLGRRAASRRDYEGRRRDAGPDGDYERRRPGRRPGCGQQAA